MVSIQSRTSIPTFVAIAFSLPIVTPGSGRAAVGQRSGSGRAAVGRQREKDRERCEGSRVAVGERTAESDADRSHSYLMDFLEPQFLRKYVQV